ncbi:hypothetical protein JTB14_020390 [Gonioctena quinquepunctata]|nr:hypothetical protein JTB14_020390 [Gonioctena quinquepunctata]
MGNFQSRCDLRDKETEKRMPRNVSRITSNLILAMFNGIFYPCVVLGRANFILDGYRVYVFHFKEETETPATNIIGNLKVLMNCEVNFFDDCGSIHTGTVRATDFREHDENIPCTQFSIGFNFFSGDLRYNSTQQSSCEISAVIFNRNE